MLPHNRRQHRTCPALCYFLHPFLPAVSDARMMGVFACVSEHPLHYRAALPQGNDIGAVSLVLLLCFQMDFIAASIYDKCSAGPSIRPICTRRCFTTTNMIQVCSNFHLARVFIINTRPDEILAGFGMQGQGDRGKCV